MRKLESLKVTLQEKKGVLKGIDTVLGTTKDEDIRNLGSPFETVLKLQCITMIVCPKLINLII